MMKRIFVLLGFVLLSACLMESCKQKAEKPPVDLSPKKTESNDVEVVYSEVAGVKTIPVKLNGVIMDMILDTGCSGISLSLTELQVMAKNGKISEKDLRGTSYAKIADGSVVENKEINIREVEIGGKNGIILHNVQASIAMNQDAPVLLGNGVLDAVASVEVDNVHKVIRFKRLSR